MKAKNENLWTTDSLLPSGWEICHKVTEDGQKNSMFQTQKFMTTKSNIYSKQDR